jgi:hypothetical protein
MKVILEFDLPEETDEHELAINGHKYQRILYEIDNKLRARIKWDTDKTWDYDTCVYIRQLITDLCIEEGVDIV